MQAMILAAGFGTRIRPWSLVRPKPLFPVMGRPLVLRLIERLRRSGFDRILVNCHHLAGQFHPLLAGETGVDIQEEEIELGTGGGLRRALAWFRDEPVLVMNGDVYHGYDPAAVMGAHAATGGRVTLVVRDEPRFNNLAVDGDGRVAGFRVGEAGPGQRLRAFTGIQVVEPELLEPIAPDRFCDIIDHYMNLPDGISVWEAGEEVYWRDMGTIGDYLALHGDIIRGRTGESPPGSPFIVDPSARIAPDAVFDGWAVVGACARVGTGSRLIRSVVWDGAVVGDGETVRDTVVAAGPGGGR